MESSLVLRETRLKAVGIALAPWRDARGVEERPALLVMLTLE